MKKMDLKKIRSSPLAEKVIFIVLAIAGAYFTDLALDEKLLARPVLHILILLCALFFDLSLLRLLHKMLKRRVIPAVKNTARKAFSALFRRIGRIARNFTGNNRNGKIFVEGKEERSFAMETRDRKNAKQRKKLPRLSKDASEREKARHAYTVFVFKREKDVPSVLTPNEVAVRLDEKGEHKYIFTNYNFARYSEEKKEI